jgi:hypothetical protein
LEVLIVLGNTWASCFNLVGLCVGWTRAAASLRKLNKNGASHCNREAPLYGRGERI